jgi:EpsI family protein
MTRFLAVAALLAVTAAYVLLNPPANLAMGGGALRACPASFGAWNGTELSFEDAVLDELKADDLLIRRYERDGHPVWLLLIYHQNRRYGAHDPELCYEAQGYTLMDRGRVRLADGSPGGLVANRFVADRPHDKRLVYHWWTTDGLSTPDAGAFRRRLAMTGMIENRSWGAFVRVETLVEEDGMEAAEARVQDFGGRVARELPALFAGAAATGAAR